jgi:signal transduction histidine kinase
MNSLRNKLWLAFGGLLLILVVVSVLTLIVLTRYSRTLERLFNENYDSAVYCDHMTQALDSLNLRAQQLIWDETITSSAPSTAADETQFETNLHLQLGNCTLPGEAELSEHVADLWSQLRTEYDQFDSAGKNRAAVYRQNLLPRFQELKRDAQSIATMNMTNMVSVDGQVKRTLIGVRNALLILVIAGTLLATVLVGTVAASLQKPLAALTASARQIESGDLELQLAVHSSDEVGQLAEAFNAMAARLREFRRIDHERLLRSEQTTQLAIDSLPDAVMVISPLGKIEISNRTAAEHFNINPGMQMQDLRLDWLTQMHRSVMNDQAPAEPAGYKSAIQLFDSGHERFLLPRAVPIFAADRRIIGVTIILVDVTRLRRADEFKSGLVSMVSHELRTPLTSIRMTILMLADGKLGQLDARQQKVLLAAKEDSERLHRIIEDLLNIGRMESGQARFEFQAIGPKQIVSQAVDPMTERLKSKNIQLSAIVPDDLPDVRADPSCIGLVLTNLLSNALKYTPAGGKIAVSAALDGQDVVFTVADSGSGVPQEYAGRIFERFFRVPQREGPAGAGLGLAIAKEIVDAHDGSIRLRSDSRGSGSTFEFTLKSAAVGRT